MKRAYIFIFLLMEAAMGFAQQPAIKNSPNQGIVSGGNCENLVVPLFPTSHEVCPGANVEFIVITGGQITYKVWQVSTDNGVTWNDIPGTDSSYLPAFTPMFDTLRLTNVSLSMNNNKYRFHFLCSGILFPYSNIGVVKISCLWTGAADTNWNNPLNWVCGFVPDQTSDVLIYGGKPRYPEINANVSCKSLKLMPGATVNVQSGYKITLTGQ